MAEKEIDFEIFEGRVRVYEQIEAMLQKANEIIRIVTTENGIVRMYKYHETLYREALTNRRVTLKIALPITKQNLWHVEYFHKMGAELRHLPEGSRNRFVNIDGDNIMCHFTSQDDIDRDVPHDSGVWTKNGEVVGMTTRFFDAMWGRLKLLEERSKELKFWLLRRVTYSTLFLAAVFVVMLVMAKLDYLKAFIASAVIVGLRTVIEKGGRVLVKRPPEE